ncbi:MAG: hypothetical protein H6835_07075 [Planctomycetes bacterium]|nr:hypothetical protein [Planctomycetota bacterium]
MDAQKQRFAPADLEQLFADAAKVVVARGKKVLTFTPGAADFDRTAFETAVIGPSGNLRAPTARVGKTWYVGFSDEAYAPLA